MEVRSLEVGNAVHQCAIGGEGRVQLGCRKPDHKIRARTLGWVGAHFDGLSGAHLRDGFNGACRALGVQRFEPGLPLVE